jgi:hypothetical protein
MVFCASSQHSILFPNDVCEGVCRRQRIGSLRFDDELLGFSNLFLQSNNLPIELADLFLQHPTPLPIESEVDFFVHGLTSFLRVCLLAVLLLLYSLRLVSG